MGNEPPTAGATRPIRLPEELARAIEARIRGSAFDSPDAFVTFVLARLLEEPGSSAFSEEDERQLKERLRSLGYID
jgi:Arc/MetJ-type ribon-helix-helix transcriptional regulator